jgi:capsule biosynthesis phosphatase
MEIENDKRIVIDIDGVIAQKNSDKEYSELQPDTDVLNSMHEYKNKGFYIILYTARNMRTYEGRLGKINANTAPVLLDWLSEHEVPYDEIRLGKPWCGNEGYYIDDRAIRPSEFTENDHNELVEMIEEEVRREPSN